MKCESWNGVKIRVNEKAETVATMFPISESGRRGDLDTGGVAHLRPYEAGAIANQMPSLDVQRVIAVKEFVSIWFCGQAHLPPISIMGDEGSSYDNGPRDLGWHMRYFHKRWEGRDVEKTGWHNPFVIPDGDGIGNARYNVILAIIANMVTTPKINDLRLALGVGIIHACTGYYWAGKYAGRPRQEKGTFALGDVNDEQWGGFSKWWPEQLAVLVALFPHPLLLDLWRQVVREIIETPADWWDGNWMARGPAGYGRCLLTLHHLGFDVMSKMKAFEAHMRNELDGSYWKNINPDVESAWSQFQLIEVLNGIRAITNGSYFFLVPLAEMLDRCTTLEGGARKVKYRVRGPEADYRYSTVNAAHGYRMARSLGMWSLADEFYREAYSSGALTDMGHGASGSNVVKSNMIRANGLGGEYFAFESIRPFVGREALEAAAAPSGRGKVDG